MKQKLRCENCGTSMDVDDLLVSQFEKTIRQELQNELSKKQAEFEKERKEFRRQQEKLDLEKQNVDDLVSARVKSLIQAKEKSLRDKIHKEIKEETTEQLEALEKELIEKSTQLKNYNGAKAQIARLQRELEEKETKIILKKEEELNQRLEEARVSIKEQAQQEVFLKMREREKVIDDLKQKLDEAKVKAEQGSMQLQGQVQELSIMDILKEIHPHDEIIQSKTGAAAADILQIVKTQTGSVCGKLYYESKRTKSWSNDWISKLKQDNLTAKADILILVSNSLPKGIERYGIIDGVWICSFKDVKELSIALRYGLLKLQQVAITQQGKETKMELLYNYLTSEEFKNVFSAIIEGFKDLQDLHHSEKLKMQRLWKEREKILEKTLSNSVNFYGSVRGIAGSSIPQIDMLELPKAS